LSECKYASLSGTQVYRDFVELPSKIMENWITQKDCLLLFARHHETDEPIPKELIEGIIAAKKYNAGIHMLGQLRLSILDMAWHSTDPSGIKDISSFEDDVVSRTRLFPKIDGTNISCKFNHIFSGGYSAGYYSYKWSEVLDADAFELFKMNGIFDQETANRFRDCILIKGNTQHPMDLYQAFLGREPDPGALLKRQGLA
jgi:peptidyl-dipeptidase Dcp